MDPETNPALQRTVKVPFILSRYPDMSMSIEVPVSVDGAGLKRALGKVLEGDHTINIHAVCILQIERSGSWFLVPG